MFVEVHVLVFVNNRDALASGAAVEPKYNFCVHVDIHSREHPELGPQRSMSALSNFFATVEEP